MEAMASELLLVYISKSTEASLPSVLGFYQWYLGVGNPNYKFIAEVVFTYCFALHVFRAKLVSGETNVSFHPYFLA